MRKTGCRFAVMICWLLFIFLLPAPRQSYSDQTFYTIQTGSFASEADARKHYDSVIQRLQGKSLDHLRIEKIGKYYSVRVGKFKGYSVALNFLQEVEPLISGAFIMEALIKDERITRLYKDASSVDDPGSTEDPLPVPIQKTIDSPVPDEINKETAAKMSAELHEQQGDMHAGNNRFILAIDEYHEAVKQGAGHPDIFFKLGVLLYSAGFPEEAVVEMEKAVRLSPHTEVFRIELGKLYLAGDRIEMAKRQFFAALKINPGLAGVYYYLGELFLRTEEYDMAWLSVRMARRLGHKGQDLVRRLRALSDEPGVYPEKRNGNNLYIRQILVDTYEKAEDIVRRLSGDELFENIAIKESRGPNAFRGGYMGRFQPSELHPRIAETLQARAVLADPVIVETGKGFHIIQHILPFDFTSWQKLLADSVEFND